MAQALTIDALVVRAPGKQAGGRVLLDLPRLALDPGTALGVRGPSGAGKSTLLHALAGLLDRVEGRIAWGATDLYAMPRARRAAFRNAHVGMIFQDFLLFEELGALDNASLSALFRPRRQRAALRAGARQHLDRLGIDAAARSVASFSGGERQRVAVARALAADPAILLADEPTASLHRDAADALIGDLLALVQGGGKTLVAVSHDPNLLARMDRVIDIADGRLTAAPDDATALGGLRRHG